MADDNKHRLALIEPSVRTLTRQYRLQEWEPHLQALGGEEASMGASFVLATGVSEEVFGTFEKAIERKRNDPRAYMEFRDGQVIIKELPNQEHEAPLEYIRGLFERYSIQEGDNFERLGSTRMQVRAGLRKEADTTLSHLRRRPSAGGHGAIPPLVGSFPALVVEVGWAEGIHELDQDAQEWLSHGTDVQTVLIFKIFKRRRDGTIALFAALYERGTAARADGGTPPSWALSFGTAPLRNPPNLGIPLTGIGAGGPPCNALQLPNYVMRIPAARLYHNVVGGVPVGPVGSHDLVLDFYDIQQRFFRYL